MMQVSGAFRPIWHASHAQQSIQKVPQLVTLCNLASHTQPNGLGMSSQTTCKGFLKWVYILCYAVNGDVITEVDCKSFNKEFI